MLRVLAGCRCRRRSRHLLMLEQVYVDKKSRPVKGGKLKNFQIDQMEGVFHETLSSQGRKFQE